MYTCNGSRKPQPSVEASWPEKEDSFLSLLFGVQRFAIWVSTDLPVTKINLLPTHSITSVRPCVLLCPGQVGRNGKDLCTNQANKSLFVKLTIIPAVLERDVL